jgi:hypothetical protein
MTRDRHKWPAIVNELMNIQYPEDAGNFLANCGNISFFRMTVLHGVIYSPSGISVIGEWGARGKNVYDIRKGPVTQITRRYGK